MIKTEESNIFGIKKVTIEEFKSNLKESYIMISDEDFEKIQTVYKYHPLAETQKDIARIFEFGGMILINDMLPRAKAIGEAKRKMLDAKRKYDELYEAYLVLQKS